MDDFLNPWADSIMAILEDEQEHDDNFQPIDEYEDTYNLGNVAYLDISDWSDESVPF